MSYSSKDDIALIGFALCLMTSNVKAAKEEISMLQPQSGAYARICTAIMQVDDEVKAWPLFRASLQELSDHATSDTAIAIRACTEVRQAINEEPNGALSVAEDEALSKGRNSHMRTHPETGEQVPFWQIACDKLDQAFGYERKWEPMKSTGSAYLAADQHNKGK